MNDSAPENLLTAWSTLLVDSLAAAGVRDVIASPGSRSTPFLLAALANPRVRVVDVIDERAAAFFALGQARVTGVPSVLLCTSGSAAAHYLPAVIEADQAGVPLLILTADRPTELMHVAANQTIDQRLLFQGYARRVVDVGAPDAAPSALRGLRRLAVQSVALARAPHPGAVHLNLRARKPLEPVVADSAPARALEAEIGRLTSVRVPEVSEGRVTAAPEVLESIARRCIAARRGLIVAGPAPASQAADRPSVRALARSAGFPLFADAASQLRFTGESLVPETAMIDAGDWLYRLPAAERVWRPDLIVQLGAPPTSGVWERFLARHPEIERIVIAPTGWPDPHSSASEFLHADVGGACRDLAIAIERLRPAGDAALDFSHMLSSVNARVRATLDAFLEVSGPGLIEPAVAHVVTRHLPAGACLVLGNSLPIRMVDAWCPGPLSEVRVLSQRGASGIDGLISGAAGAASVADGPVVLLVGDVSALHDIGGLALGSVARVPLVVVVVNNKGGRIFEQLPVGKAVREDALRHFTTPHARDFEHAARLYGCAFHRVATRAALEAALAVALDQPRCTLIDAVVPPHGAAEGQRLILEALRSAGVGT